MRGYFVQENEKVLKEIIKCQKDLQMDDNPLKKTGIHRAWLKQINKS